jgi:hypothetical protein
MLNQPPMLGLPGNKPSVLPEQLPSEQRERVAVLTILHEGKAFSPSEVYRLRDPESDPELARLPTLLVDDPRGAASI